MIINYFNIKPLDITEPELDEYEKYIGLPLYKEDREAILKFTAFRKILTIRKRLKFNTSENLSLNDLTNNE
ncbi:hypothetical protein LEP1GSC170_0554 [Leptospira interrogans serovar Bataviae str. HAI135]|nr:hypothetical protein LEP1GSC170_0554 [Leptospira interrogans serovar Bataviae str. HAI135]